MKKSDAMKKIALLLCSVLLATDLMARPAAPKPVTLTDEERQLVENNCDFAFRLFSKYRDGEARADKNLVLSPLSITYALGMLNNGATGETQQQISTVLGGAAGAPAVVNGFCRKMLDASGTLDESTKVLVANNIYVNADRSYRLLPAFVQAAADYYDATPETRSFADGMTRDAINQWAADHTGGMIREPLKADEFDPMVISYLLNALYFKAEWTLPFDKTLTRKQFFDDGRMTADMMEQTDHFEYAENDVCQSIRLPYGNGAFQMTVFLPRQGLTVADLLATMSGKNWDSMSYADYVVSLSLPRFETATDQRLEAIMASLGMPRAFDPYNAQFDGFAVNDAAPDMPIYIAFMKQSAKISVSENGTEAAAVTVVGMKDGASPDTKYASFIADRPFLYVISERSTGTIFFMGQFTGEESREGRPLKPMLVQGKTWHYTHYLPEAIPQPDGKGISAGHGESIYEECLTVKGDTVIDGRDYVKIYRCGESGSYKYYGAFREDMQGRVWQYDVNGNKKDFLVCDVTCASYAESGDTVLADVVSVGRQQLNRYLCRGTVGIEGVGLEHRGLNPYLFGLDPDPIDYVTFDYVDGGGIFFTDADFRTPRHIALTADERQLVERNNGFALRLFRQARGQESCILSPLSITYALGMLNNGAAGQTLREINTVLGSSDTASPDAINEMCLKLAEGLHTAGCYDNSKVSIANTIFVNQGMGYRLQADFERQAQQYYGAEPQNRDFADGETRDVINQWACDHTEGMIREVLSESEFNPLAVSYLLNAIYFKGLWAAPFNAANTVEEPFGGGEAVPMMHQEGTELQYDEDDLCQTVVMPYGNGTYQMQVFLPREGRTIDEVLAVVASGSLAAKPRLQTYEVDLKMPRFQTDTSIDLVRIMSALGMPSVFLPTEADLSRFCVSDFGQRIYISKMKQVARIDVSEEGTEAAAVTVIAAEATAEPDHATFHADRPFFYTISEQSTGAILFMGQYTGTGTTDAISSATSVARSCRDSQCPIYNLAGQRLLTPPAKGLYIRNGQKTLAK